MSTVGEAITIWSDNATTWFISSSHNPSLYTPVGMVIEYAASAGGIPLGWFECDGSAKSRTTYVALFNKIGITYGAGDGATTFNLPENRDRFVVGAGTTYALAATGGSTTKQLVKQNLPPHVHTLEKYVLMQGAYWQNGALRWTNIALGTTGDGSADGLAGTAFDILPPYMAYRKIIKF